MRILLSDIGSHAFCFSICSIEVGDKFLIASLLFNKDFGGSLGGVE